MPTMKAQAEIKRAQEARAWLAGGSAPYNTAKICGYKSVPDMMDAIKRLDAPQDTEPEDKPAERIPVAHFPPFDTVKAEPEIPEAPAPRPAQRKFGPAAVTVETPEQPAEVPAAAPFPPKRSQAFTPDAMIRVGGFNVQHITNGSMYKDQVRIYNVGREGFIVFERSELARLANQLSMFNQLLEAQAL